MSISIITGPPQSGKSFFARQLVSRYIQQGERPVYTNFECAGSLAVASESLQQKLPGVYVFDDATEFHCSRSFGSARAQELSLSACQHRPNGIDLFLVVPSDSVLQPDIRQMVRFHITLTRHHWLEMLWLRSSAWSCARTSVYCTSRLCKRQIFQWPYPAEEFPCPSM